MEAKLVVLLSLLATAYSLTYRTAADPVPWAHRFTLSPIRVPGFPGGFPFPASFPFPITYPLPFGFPYAPNVYESILPSLVAQYNAVLAITANNNAAAAAAAAAAAPAISFNPADTSPTTPAAATPTAPPVVAPAYRYFIGLGL